MGYEKRLTKNQPGSDFPKSLRTIKDFEGSHNARDYAPGETQSVMGWGENAEPYNLTYRSVQLQGDNLWELLRIERA